MKVVINAAHGGFGVSRAAVLALRERGNDWAKNTVICGECWEDGSLSDHEWNDYDLGSIQRHDPDLVAVIEEMGEQACGDNCYLKIVEIPDDVKYEVVESECGFESIHEVHRVWR